MIRALSIFIITALLSFPSHSQITASSWYHISTDKFFRFSVNEDELKWVETGFGGEDLAGKSNAVRLLSWMTEGLKLGYIHQDKDSSNSMSYGLTVFMLAKDSSYMDLDMECSAETYEDTTGMRRIWHDCPLPGKMVMRYYSEKTIRLFKQMPSISTMSPTEAAQVRRQLEQEKIALIKKYGEEKLLWVAPVIFQQVLTDLLLQKGYSPLFTRDQAEKLFDFHFY